MMRKKLLVFFLLIIAAAALVACGNGGDSDSTEDTSAYPERPIDVVIPYASGGSADLQARVIGDFLQTELDQTVNIVAKGGGAGSTGMNFVKSSDNDGYTIILTAVGPSTLTPNANEVGYKVTEDFEPIAQITEAPYGLAVNADSGIDTLEELFEMSETEAVTYGTTGAGLHQHVVTSALVNELDDVNMEHIPFDGGAEAVSALLGNHTTASVNTISEITPHVESGDLKILAVTADERLDNLPDVPTFSELGYELIGQGAWFGFMAPKDTPDEIVQLLDEAIAKALEDDTVMEQLGNAGLPISYIGHEDFTKKVAEEDEKNAEVVESLNE